jgi:flavorubredoxin
MDSDPQLHSSLEHTMEEITTTLAAVHGVVVAVATMEDAPTSSSASRMPRSAA